MATERSSPERSPAPERGRAPDKRGPASQLRRAALALPRAVLWLVLSVIGLAVLLVIASFFVDEPMRRSMEKEINRR